MNTAPIPDRLDATESARRGRRHQGEVKISKFTAQHIRGISIPVTVEFLDGNRKPSSFIIQGENGAGKTSLVDAIEFAFRGKISRRGLAGEKSRRELRNLTSPDAPGVAIELSNSQLYLRGAIGSQETHRRLARNTGIPEVGDWPVSIRRRDIDDFWKIPEEYRLELFLDYFLDLDAEFIDIRSRTKAVKKYDEASANLRAIQEQIRPYATAWRGDWPEHLSGAEAFKRFLLSTNQNRRLPSAEKKQLRQLLDDHSSIIELRNLARGPASLARSSTPFDLSAVSDAIQRVTPEALNAFRSATGYDWISDLAADIDEFGTLALRLILSDGSEVNPPDILSEAYLDLLALIYLICLHAEKAKHSKRRFIILDDVFQSVDTPLRLLALDIIRSKLQGWQIIITVHDHGWMRAASKSLGDQDTPTLRLWRQKGENGPSITPWSSARLADLDRAESNGSAPTTIAQTAGVLLEEILSELTFEWSIRVNRPNNDHYMGQMLWDTYGKFLKGCADPLISEPASKLSSRIFIRNITAHPDPAGATLSDTEARQYATLVRSLCEGLMCTSQRHFCETPKSELGWPRFFKCRCNSQNS